MRLSPEQRRHNETRIRATIDQLLRGEPPPGGKCDIKTLARQAGIDRTAFYGTAPTPTSAKSSKAASPPSARTASALTPAMPRSTG
jgi:hypothetical protein